MNSAEQNPANPLPGPLLRPLRLLYRFPARPLSQPLIRSLIRTLRRSPRRTLALAPLLVLCACSSGQAVLPDWGAGATRSQAAYATPARRAAGAAPAQIGGVLPGYSPWRGAFTERYYPRRGAFTELYYPWYGWSPLLLDAYPYPWAQAWGPAFRSWVYTPPFGDADGRSLVFPSPGAALPAYASLPRTSLTFLPSTGRPKPPASWIRSAPATGISRLEDFSAPREIRTPALPVPGGPSPAARGLLDPASRTLPAGSRDNPSNRSSLRALNGVPESVRPR